MQHPVQFRPIGPRDESFLLRVFSSTRPDVAASNLGEQQQAEFLRMQFHAQHNHYVTNFSDADFLIVLSGPDPIGRLYVHRGTEEIRILDMALLPEYRNQGIGSQMMAELVREARVADKPIRIYVEVVAAKRFCERFGFVQIGETGAHILMEWSPSKGLVY